MRHLLISLSAFGALALTQAPSPALAQSSGMGVDVTATSPSTRTLSIAKGKSAIIDLPADARDVLVTRPGVADAVLRTPRRIYILGVASGQTDAVFFDQTGRKILSLDIRVDQDGKAAAETIARILPMSRIRVEAVNNSLILTGTAASAADADAALRIAQQFVDKPEQALNMIGIAGKEQVMLKVRIVEVQRNAIKQLGLNLQAVIGQLDGFRFNFIQQATFGVSGQPSGGATIGGESRGGRPLRRRAQGALNGLDWFAPWPSRT